MGAIGVVELDGIADVDALRARFIAEGVFMRPFGNIVYLTPAFTIAPDELAALTAAVVKVVERRHGRERPVHACRCRSGAAGGTRGVPPTPQYAWPLLAAVSGAEVVVKHENHTPIGAFKVRGGLVYLDRLKRARPEVAGIVSATRGNHGQSLAFAGRRAGLAVTIVVPHGNSVEKNAAMRGFGAELVEYGSDFDEAKSSRGGGARARLRIRAVLPPRPRDRRCHLCA